MARTNQDISGKNNPMYGTHRVGTTNPNYKNGKTLKIYKCSKCKKEISLNSALYGKGKCGVCSKIGRGGLKKEKNPGWQGGISKQHYPSIFRIIKRKILLRDQNICQGCYKTTNQSLLETGKILSVHHIDYCKHNCEENNLITLCHVCNMRANADRDYWYAFYTYIIEHLTS